MCDDKDVEIPLGLVDDNNDDIFIWCCRSYQSLFDPCICAIKDHNIYWNLPIWRHIEVHSYVFFFVYFS